MHARDFCFWLQGFFEVANPDGMTREQVSMVKRHLALVFKHEIDPAMGDAQHQTALNDIHSPTHYWDYPTTDADFRPRC